MPILSPSIHQVMKDLDALTKMRNSDDRILKLSAPQLDLLTRAIRRDISFLENLNLMDYSLLVGIEALSKQGGPMSGTTNGRSGSGSGVIDIDTPLEQHPEHLLQPVMSLANNNNNNNNHNRNSNSNRKDSGVLSQDGDSDIDSHGGNAKGGAHQLRDDSEFLPR